MGYGSIDCGTPAQVGSGATIVYYGCQPVGDFPAPWDPWDKQEPILVQSEYHPIGEFAVMAAIDALPDDAKRRVLAWLNARLDMTPKPEK